MDHTFQIFGSKGSIDYDIVVFVESLGSIKLSKRLCEYYDNMLYDLLIAHGYVQKPVNTNLAVLKDGYTTEVYKGTKEEVNNSLLDTYDYHDQLYPLFIKSKLIRDIPLKVDRCARNVLMMLSRTHLRKQIKPVLKLGISDKIKVLETIDFTTIHDLGSKNMTMVEYLKGTAFQLGQTIALLDGYEFYTKEDLSEYFPELEPFLMREESDKAVLNKYMNLFVDKVKCLM